VDGSDRKTPSLLRGAGISFLIRRIHDERFEGIAAGLYDIFKCDAALGREVLSQLDVRFLEAKAKLEHSHAVYGTTISAAVLGWPQYLPAHGLMSIISIRRVLAGARLSAAGLIENFFRYG
jgi:hypothetical protein